MQWLPDFIKQISVSKTVAFGLLCTALVLTIGPKIYPEYIDVVPKPWNLAVLAVLIYSSSVLFVAALQQTFKLIKKSVTKLFQYWQRRKINEEQKDLLSAFVERGRGEINLTIEMRNWPGNKQLKCLATVKELKNMGYVESGYLDETVIWLTESGRTKGMQIFNDKKNHNKAKQAGTS